MIAGTVIFPGRYKYNRSTVHTVQLISMPSIKPQQATAVSKPVKKTEPIKKTENVKKSVPITKPKPNTITIPKPKSISIPKKKSTPSLEEKLSKRLEEVDKEDFTEPEAVSKPTVTSAKAISSSEPELNIGVSAVSNFPFQYYLDIIHDKISASWHEPEMLLDKQYTVIVTFAILEDGSVNSIFVKKGSGISNFDQSGIRAIEQARPFPQLPPGYSHSQLTINVAFNLE